MSRRAHYLLVGGICGLAWSAALRGWMAQLADGMPNSHSEVTWLTLVLVLLPGTIVGALLAYSAYLWQAGRPGSRWLMLSPALFATALLDPKILAGLVKNGTGGGSLIVIATALSLGSVLSRPSWSVIRGLLALISALGVLVIFGMGTMAAPVATPRGAWVSLYGSSLVLLLGLASALPYGPSPARPGRSEKPPPQNKSEYEADASANPRPDASSNDKVQSRRSRSRHEPTGGVRAMPLRSGSEVLGLRSDRPRSLGLERELREVGGTPDDPPRYQVPGRSAGNLFTRGLRRWP